MSDVNPHTLKEIAHFFATYKQLQKKVVEVGDFEDAATAKAAFERATKMYVDKK